MQGEWNITDPDGNYFSLEITTAEAFFCVVNLRTRTDGGVYVHISRRVPIETIAAILREGFKP